MAQLIPIPNLSYIQRPVARNLCGIPVHERPQVPRLWSHFMVILRKIFRDKFAALERVDWFTMSYEATPSR